MVLRLISLMGMKTHLGYIAVDQKSAVTAAELGETASTSKQSEANEDITGATAKSSG